MVPETSQSDRPASLLKRILEADARYTHRLGVAEKPGMLRTFAAIFAHSGDSWFWLLGLLIVWLIGDDAWKGRAIALSLGVIVTAVLVLIVKFTVRRKRPEGEWGAVYRSTDPHSFPSGHAARAVMLAVLAVGLGPIPFGILLAVWAPLVSLARVAMGVHYLSDVIAGAVFGLVMGLIILVII